MSILVPVILTLLVAIASTSTRVEAAGRDNVLIEKAGVVKQDLGVTKTDFDLMVTSDTQLILPPGSFAVINVNGGGNVRPTSVVGEGTRALTFEWDLSFAPDDTVLYAFSAIERRRNKFVVNAFFTPKQSPTDIPSLGWDVSQSGDVFLLNGYASAIHFDNLLFQLPSTLDVDALFVLIEGNPSGIAGFVTSGNVPAVGLDGAPGELLVAHFPLSPGDFLTARLDSRFVDGGFSHLTEIGALGHEHPVSEPSALVLIVFGIIVVFADSRWRGASRGETHLYQRARSGG